MQSRQVRLGSMGDATPDALGALQAINPHLLLVFGDAASLRHPELSSNLRVAFPSAELVGCTSQATVCAEGVYDSGLVLSAVRFHNPGMRIVSTRLTEPADSEEAGRRIGMVLRPQGIHSALVFAPGTGIDMQLLVRGIGSVLPRARVAGGFAGAPSQDKTFTLHNMVVASDQIVAIGFSNSRLRMEQGHGDSVHAVLGTARITDAADFALMVHASGSKAHKKDQDAMRTLADSGCLLAGFHSVAAMHLDGSPSGEDLRSTGAVFTLIRES